MNKEESIERCNQLIKAENANWIGISNQKAIETVLNLIQEQENNKIENIIEELTITNPANLSEKGLELFNKINEIIDENEEFKDKIDKISQNRYNELRVNGILFCGTDIKQYFEEEVEKEYK